MYRAELRRLFLQYAYGAQSVKCAVCNHVTATNQGANLHRQGSGAPPPKPPTQTVVVENPSTLDEQGNEVGGPSQCSPTLSDPGTYPQDSCSLK